MSESTPSAPLVSLETWIGAISSSACIGFTSLVPWLFNMTFFEQKHAQKGIQAKNSRMDYLLSFSVGAILGDIFFHLIPESLESHLVELKLAPHIAQREVGLSVVAGIFMFIIVEMILEKWSSNHSHDDMVSTRMIEEDVVSSSIIGNMDLKKTPTSTAQVSTPEINNNNDIDACQDCRHRTSHDEYHKVLCPAEKEDPVYVGPSLKQRKLMKDQEQSSEKGIPPEKTSDPSSTSSIASHIIDPAGYLSLIANGIDNFTHGLAIGASFLAGPKMGLLTTFVIFIHEIPHEICDYAILVNSGFSRWDAVKAQSSVSLFGTMGTATALYFKSIDTLNAKTIWILPFSAGGFLYIALVNLLPEILSRRTSLRGSIEQILCVILGIVFMGAVALS